MGDRKRGVLVTVSVSLQYFVNITFMKSLGMLLIAMQEEFSADTWMLGSIFAAVECVSDLLSPIVGPLGKKFGPRPVAMTGGVLVATGFIITSQASSILQVALAMDTLIALGYCFVNVLTRAELGRHFDDSHFILASGFVQAGGAISMITQPPLVQLFLNTYGWRGTMLLLASVCAHLVVSGALLIPSNSPEVNDVNLTCQYQPLKQTTNGPGHSENSKNGVCTSLRSLCQSVGKAFDLSLMKDFNFWVVVSIFVVTRVSSKVWVIYFVPQAVAKGFSNDFAAVMVTIAGVGQLVGTLLVTVAIFKEKVTSTSAMMAAIVLQATALFTLPWITFAWLMSVNAVLVLSSTGSIFAIGYVMVKTFLSVERLASAYGWSCFMSGIFRIFSGFAPGWIYDHSSSYDLSFMIFGVVQMATVVPLILSVQRQHAATRTLTGRRSFVERRVK